MCVLRIIYLGDFRVNVVPSLGWSHTAFMREHNRIAKELAELNPHWDDEIIFQEARRIIGAIVQVNKFSKFKIFSSFIRLF